MNGFGANHAGEMFAANQDRLTGKLALINAAHQVKAVDAVAFIFHDHKADLIHVGIEHHTQICLFFGFAQDKHIAHGVYFDLIGNTLELCKDDAANFHFISGNPDGIAQFFDQSDLVFSDLDRSEGHSSISFSASLRVVSSRLLTNPLIKRAV